MLVFLCLCCVFHEKLALVCHADALPRKRLVGNTVSTYTSHSRFVERHAARSGEDGEVNARLKNPARLAEKKTF